MFALNSGHDSRQGCPGLARLPLSCGHLQPAATGLESTGRIGMSVGGSPKVSSAKDSDHGLSGGLRGFNEACGGCDRLVI